MSIKIHILIIIFIEAKCSIVFDGPLQSALNVTDYCPEIGVCKEGSHVMCTDYNPNYTMGPTCAGVENATMTEDNAALILDLINSIRSRAARGLAMGYEKELLPRAYGMYRVEWDPELATLAQVWANQCVLERDNCRATKNFPDPGQQASIARFVTDKWIPISKTKDKTYNESSGFNSHKVIRLVCNFSSRVYDDRGIYNVTAPTTSEFTPQCGCPPGYDEDSWCLCYKSEKNKTKPCKIHHNPKKTYVAVVPIFTVEDYPGPYQRSRINNTKSLSLKKIRNQHTKSRRFNTYGQFNPFSNFSIYGSPTRKVKDYGEIGKTRKDVPPRKDFSKTKHILFNYLSMRKTINLRNNTIKNIENQYRSSLPIKNINKKNNIVENKFHKKDTAEASIMMQQKRPSPASKSIQDDGNLLRLIHKLESEAKHINLNEHDRKILNNEIRELYNVVKNTYYILRDNKKVYIDIGTSKRNEIFTNDLKNRYFNNQTGDNKVITIREFPTSTNNFQYSTNYKNSLPGNALRTLTYYSGKHVHKTNEKIKDMDENLGKHSKSDGRKLSLTKKMYYQKRINDIKRKLTLKYNYHNKSQTQLNYNNNLYEKESTEKDKAEFPIFLRRRNKKKHHGNNNNDLQPKSSRKNEKRKKLNKKRKPKAKYNKKFIKTTLKDIDRDSNMSGSKDSDSKNKPVDIIVHIKMNE
nr:protein PFF0380w-like [Danaus plexippus plexippus]